MIETEPIAPGRERRGCDDRQMRRARFRLLLGVALVMAGNGVLLLVFGVRATKAGFGPSVTSLIIGAYYGGFIAGSLSAPVLVRRLATARSFMLLCAIVAAAAIAPPLFVNPFFWTFLRLMLGFSFAAMYVVVESWLNRSTPNDERARVLGVYLAVVMAAFAAGSLLVPVVGTKGHAPFLLAFGLAIAGAVAALGLPEPGFTALRAHAIGFRQLVQRARLGTASTAVTGFANAAFISSLAVWATRNGYSEARTSVFSTMASAGPLLIQIPLARWSDRSTRPRVMLIVTLVAAVVSIGGALGPVNGYTPMIGIFVLGGLTYTLYSINGAETNDHLRLDEMPSAGGYLILLTGLGAIAGSITVGVATRWMGNNAMFWVVATAHLVIAALILILGPAGVVGRSGRLAHLYSRT